LDDLIIESNFTKNKNEQKKKSDRIIELLMKIKACPDTCSILIKIHGESLIDQIISHDCDENFLSQLENTIRELDSFKKTNLTLPNNNNKISKNYNSDSRLSGIKTKTNNNDDYNYNNNDKNISQNNQNKVYQFENEDYIEAANKCETNAKSEIYQATNQTNQINQIKNINPKRHQRQLSNIAGSRSDFENLILSGGDRRDYSTKNNTQPSCQRMRRSHSKSTLNASRNSKSRSKGKVDLFEDSVSSDAKFEQILRKYGGRQMSGKVFMNYSRKVGDFFDATLQKGGNSSLDLKDQSRKRSGSRGRSGNTINNSNTVSVSYSQNHNM